MYAFAMVYRCRCLLQCERPRMAIVIAEKQQALLGLRIMLALQARGWGVHQLAKQSGIQLNAVQRICRGEGKQPSLWTIGALARVLDVSLDYLAGETADPTRHGENPT